MLYDYADFIYMRVFSAKLRREGGVSPVSVVAWLKAKTIYVMRMHRVNQDLLCITDYIEQ